MCTLIKRNLPNKRTPLRQIQYTGPCITLVQTYVGAYNLTILPFFCGVTCYESSRSKGQASSVDNCNTSTFDDVSDSNNSTDNAAVSDWEQEIQ